MIKKQGLELDLPDTTPPNGERSMDQLIDHTSRSEIDKRKSKLKKSAVQEGMNVKRQKSYWGSEGPDMYKDMLEFTEKYQILQNVHRDIKQTIVGDRQDLEMSGVHIEDLKDDACYRIVSFKNTVISLSCNNTKLAANNKNELADIWQISNQGENKFRLSPYVSPLLSLSTVDGEIQKEPYLQLDSEVYWTLRHFKENDSSVYIELPDQHLRLQNNGFLEKLAYHRGQDEVRRFFIKQVSQKEIDQLQEQQNWLDKVKINEIDYPDWDNKKLEPFQSELTMDDLRQKRDEDDYGKDINATIEESLLPCKQLEKEVAKYLSHDNPNCDFVQSYRMVRFNNQPERTYAIQSIFQKDTFKLVIHKIIPTKKQSFIANKDLDLGDLQYDQKKDFFMLEKKFGPVILLKDERLRNMHPEFISYKINDDSIEFVVVKEGHNVFDESSLLVDDQGHKTGNKTLLLVKYDIANMKAVILNQAKIHLADLIGVNDDQGDAVQGLVHNINEDTLMLPVYHIKQVNPGARYKNTFMTQVCEMDNDQYLTSRVARTFVFQGNTIEFQSSFPLPQMLSFNMPTIIFIDRGYLQEKLQKFEEESELVFNYQFDNLICCFDYINLTQLLIDYPLKSKSPHKIVKLSKVNEEQLKRLQLVLNLDINIKNTLIEQTTKGQVERFFSPNLHNYMRNFMRRRVKEFALNLQERQFKRGIKSLLPSIQANYTKTAFYDDGDFMTVLIAYQERTVIFRFNTKRTRVKVPEKILSADIETCLSQYCFYTQRSYGLVDVKIHDTVIDQWHHKHQFGSIISGHKYPDDILKFRPYLENNKALWITPQNNLKIIASQPNQDLHFDMDGCDRIKVQESIYLENDLPFIPILRVKYGASLELVIVNLEQDFSSKNKNNQIQKEISYNKFTKLDLGLKVTKQDLVYLAQSSEIQYPDDFPSEEQNKEGFYTVNYQVQVLESQQFTHIYEIQLKIFSDITVHPMIVGRKLLIMKEADIFHSLFAKEDGKIQIMGTQVGNCIMPNPDHTSDLEAQFDFVGSFTCTRVRQCQDYLVAESYLKDSWVKIGHIQKFLMTEDKNMIPNRAIGKENHELMLNILENSIHLAMNSQTFDIIDYMNSGFQGSLMEEESLRRKLIAQNRFFKSSAILDGRCIAELTFDYNDIMQQIKLAHNRDFDQVLEELNLADNINNEHWVKNQADDIWLSPLEKYIREANNPRGKGIYNQELTNDSEIEQRQEKFDKDRHELNKLVKEKFLLQTVLVYFNFDYISNVELMLKHMHEQFEYAKAKNRGEIKTEKIRVFKVDQFDIHLAIQELIDHLQESNMTSAYKRAQIFSCLEEGLKYRMDNTDGQTIQLKWIIEFLEDFQEHNLQYGHFRFEEEIDDRNMEAATGRAYLRIGGFPKFKNNQGEHFSKHMFEVQSHENVEKRFGQGSMMIDLPGEQKTDSSCWHRYLPECIKGSMTQVIDLQPYYVNFQDYNQSRAVYGVFDDDDLNEYIDYQDRMWKDHMSMQNLSLFCSDLFLFCKREKMDIDDMGAINDLINHQYYVITERNFLFNFIIYTFGYMGPLIIVLTQQSIPWLVTICCSVCIVIQSYSLFKEIRNVYRVNNIERLVNFKEEITFCDTQNLLDLTSIFLSIIFCAIRLAFVGKEIDLSNTDQKYVTEQIKNITKDGTKTINDFVPIFAILIIPASFLQWFFFLKASEKLNEQLKLMNKTLRDAGNFLVFQILIGIGFYLCQLQIGTQFDDGGNYADDYNTNYNDYPTVSGNVVQLIAAFRTAVGDFQMPEYDYWTARYNAGDKFVAQFYIYITWALYVIQVFIMSILALNLLISIVAESFTNIKQNSLLIKMQGRILLNIDSAVEFDGGPMSEPLNTILFCTKAKGQGNGADDEGDTKGMEEQLMEKVDELEQKIQEMREEDQEFRSQVLDALKRIPSVRDIDNSPSPILSSLKKI